MQSAAAKLGEREGTGRCWRRLSEGGLAESAQGALWLPAPGLRNEGENWTHPA